ncbi:MAG TPA: Wzz/FepE/Etk N-terminal domain-containing protein [Chloroflexota bacterium]|jgi:uncharacterized protein involved in exopolysaccharide biosynthesis
MIPRWFDWRRCLLTLVHSWPLIVATTLIVAVLAGTYRLVLAPNTYEADALVLVSRPRYQVELESKIKSNQEPLAGTALNLAAMRSRLDTMAMLARSSEVERTVQQRLASSLSELEQQPGRLVPRIRVRPTNEMLRISATASDPAVAADLANTWAEEVANRVEAVYSSSSGARAVEVEVQNAHDAYEKADRELARFSIDHPLDELNRRVESKTQEVNLMLALQDQRLGYLRGRALSLYRSINDIDQVIRDAETLRSQLGEGARSQAASSGDALALMMLRVRTSLAPSVASQLGGATQGTTQAAQAAAGATAAGTAAAANQAAPAAAAPAAASTILQVAPATLAASGDRSADRIEDVNSMITALRDRRDALQAEFETLSQRFRSGDDPASALALPADDPTEVALRQAQQELHESQAEQTELVRQRDELGKQQKLLGTSYETLLNKAQELRVLQATDDNGGVTVAERAVPQQAPIGPGPLRFVLMGAIFGLLLGCALALLPLVRGWLRKALSTPLRDPASPEEDRATAGALY